MDMVKLRLLVEKRGKKRSLDTELFNLKAEIAAIEAELIPQFEQEALQSVTLGTGETAYLRSQEWAKKADKTTPNAMLVAAMIAAGFQDFTTANWASLSAHVRTRGIPPALVGLIEIKEIFNVGVRGAGFDDASDHGEQP